MFLSLKQEEEKILFAWQGDSFRYEGELSANDELLETLTQWQKAYQRYLVFAPRIEFEEDDDESGSFNLTRDLEREFSQLTELLNVWLRSSEAFLQADREALQQSDRYLSLVIDPTSELALLPWEYCFLAQDYSLSYASPRFSPANRAKGRGILGILGKMGEGDRSILEQYGATILEKPDLDVLCQALRTSGAEIVYYGGHSDGEKLYFNEAVPSDRLRRAVKASAEKGAKLFFANSCNGSGLVWLDLPLSAFLIWKIPVPDRVARDFAEFFFEALSNGDYGKAFYEARERLGDKYADILGILSLVQLWQRSEVSRPSPAIDGKRGDRKQQKAIAATLEWTGVLGNSLRRRMKTGISLTLLFLTLGSAALAWEFSLKESASDLVNRERAKAYKQGKLKLVESERLLHVSKFLNDDNGKVYYNLGEIAERRGDKDLALAHYQKSAERGTVEAFINVARLELTRGRYQSAIDSAFLCLDLLKNIDNPWKNDNKILCLTRLAQGYFGLGDLQIARANIQKALELITEEDPYYFDVYCFALRIDLGLGDRDKAEKWGKLLLRIGHDVSAIKKIKPGCLHDARAVVGNSSDR
ncbi:MAG: hypothetical protein J7647_03920 [Cyanobacteria bacterium SBLK]|nr:hypothetical protein [Cyanobacteria bacterium SBLK]